jgi:DNA-binding NtrC family response regulator
LAATENSSSTAWLPGSPRALVASPDPYFREQMATTLRASNWPVEEALGGAEALVKLGENNCRVLLLDHWLADLDVLEVVGVVRKRFPGVSVYVVDAASALTVSSQGSENSPKQSPITNLLETLRLQEHTIPGRFDPALFPSAPDATPDSEQPLPEMIGLSPAMRQVYRLARLVAPRPTTVLIVGCTGTGKELVARAIHLLSPRSRQPFVTVNCAAIPEPLLESELFGYARGAFTGALQTRIGRVHAAHGGTLFLDEIGDLPLSMQAKLLRFLQDGEVQRLGSSDVLRVDVRVIGATNADLSERVRRKEFREDLYYRLSVFPIEIESLQKRIEDIRPLGLHFLNGFCRESGAPIKKISSAAQAVLERHSWPGNIRELRHIIERAFILAGDSHEILPEHIRIQAVNYPDLEASEVN